MKLTRRSRETGRSRPGSIAFLSMPPGVVSVPLVVYANAIDSSIAGTSSDAHAERCQDVAKVAPANLARANSAERTGIEPTLRAFPKS